jgi:hypothetical protein
MGYNKNDVIQFEDIALIDPKRFKILNSYWINSKVTLRNDDSSNRIRRIDDYFKFVRDAEKMRARTKAATAVPAEGMLPGTTSFRTPNPDMFFRCFAGSSFQANGFLVERGLFLFHHYETLLGRTTEIVNGTWRLPVKSNPISVPGLSDAAFFPKITGIAGISPLSLSNCCMPVQGCESRFYYLDPSGRLCDSYAVIGAAEEYSGEAMRYSTPIQTFRVISNGGPGKCGGIYYQIIDQKQWAVGVHIAGNMTYNLMIPFSKLLIDGIRALTAAPTPNPVAAVPIHDVVRREAMSHPAKIHRCDYCNQEPSDHLPRNCPVKRCVVCGKAAPGHNTDFGPPWCPEILQKHPNWGNLSGLERALLRKQMSKFPSRVEPIYEAFSDEKTQKFDALLRATAPPPDGYVCHKCGVPGHWLPVCPKWSVSSPSRPPVKSTSLEEPRVKVSPLSEEDVVSALLFKTPAEIAALEERRALNKRRRALRKSSKGTPSGVGAQSSTGNATSTGKISPQ